MMILTTPTKIWHSEWTVDINIVGWQQEKKFQFFKTFLLLCCNDDCITKDEISLLNGHN